jgi:hypothetical protein
MAAAMFHDQPLDLPYLAVGRTDRQFAVYAYPAGWDVVDGDLLRGFRFAPAGLPDHSPVHKHPVHLLRGVVWVPVPGGVEVPHALGLLGGRSVWNSAREQRSRIWPVVASTRSTGTSRPGPCRCLGDCEMSDLPGARINDYAAHLTARSIGATGAGPDPERHRLRFF